jgi:hypothetical protein
MTVRLKHMKFTVTSSAAISRVNVELVSDYQGLSLSPSPGTDVMSVVLARSIYSILI